LSAELCRLDATAQADLVRRGEIKPIELVETAIDRIERLNPHLNAVITPLVEQARAQACAPDLPDGPFRGVPLLLKDYFCQVAGTPYYEGMRCLREIDWRSPYDTYLAARFRAAGFIFLGKTNLPELAGGPITDSAAFGPARNPFALARTAGGSSGGSAAAVACGMVAVAHGNDGTGSLRIPASCCGLIGLKPSRGRISPGPARGGGLLGNVSEFVLTRSVRDAAALLDAVAGSMPGDLFVAPTTMLPWREAMLRIPGRMRVGLLSHDPVLKEDPPDIPGVCADSRTAVADTGRLLAQLGHEVEEAYPPALDRPTGLGLALGILSASGLAATLDAWAERIGRPIGPHDVEPGTWERANEGRTITAERVHWACQRLIAGACRVQEWWALGYDLLVTPTMAQLPPELDAARQATRLQLAGQFGLFTMPYSFSGQPAISLPLYWTADGLPVGVQIVADYGREDLLLQVAAQLEAAQPWMQRYPI
jgi:amidase